MSADESALLAAVAADPAADLPRLVYADWLDDHGQPVRAEFIRVQCHLARLDDRPQWERNREVHLYARQQELLDDYRAELVGDLPELPTNPVDVVWERGFIAKVTLDADRFLQLAGRLAARVPLPRVVVEQAAGSLTELLDCPHLDCLAAVAFDSLDLRGGELPLGDDPDRLGETLGRLPRLDALDVSRCWLTDDLVGELLQPGGFPALRTLDLSYNALTDAGLVGLLDTGLPQRLTRLVLDGNDLSDAAAFELADRLSRVPTFRTLDIRGTHIGQPGHSALTAAFGSRCNLF